MARPFVAPDPKDRSVNEPTCMVSAAQVLGLYNQENDDNDKKERVVDSVKEWYVNTMKNDYGWHEASFHGNQCLLEAKVVLSTRTVINKK